MLAAFVLHVAWLSVYVAPFIPIVTAAVVKLRAPAWLKVSVTAALATAVAVVTTAIEQDADLILRWSILAKIAMSFGIALGSYLFLRSTPLVAGVEKNTQDKGIG